MDLKLPHKNPLWPPDQPLLFSWQNTLIIQIQSHANTHIHSKQKTITPRKNFFIALSLLTFFPYLGQLSALAVYPRPRRSGGTEMSRVTQVPFASQMPARVHTLTYNLPSLSLLSKIFNCQRTQFLIRAARRRLLGQAARSDFLLSGDCGCCCRNTCA